MPIRFRERVVLDRKMREHMGELAAQPDMIQYLVQEDCRGELFNAQSCPLAVYLSRKLGGLQMSVAPTYVRVPGATKIEIELPDQLASFVHDFDEGAYPELQLPPS